MSAGERSTDRAEAVLEHVAAQSIAQMGGENFPVAMRLLPKRPRADLARVYAFARFVDDVGDRAPGDRLRLLDVVEDDLRRLPRDESELAPVSGLRPLVDDGVPLEPFLDLVEANRVDQCTKTYETFEELLGYCRLSAAPVGRIVLHIAGAATPGNVADSDAVCAGLQVLEHCQDVGEDARSGRIYLPAVELRAAGVANGELAIGLTSAGLREVVAVQVDRSDELLAAGSDLVRRLTGWARVAVAGFVGGGRATSAALRRSGFDVLAEDIRPSRVSTAAHALRLVGPW